MPPVAGHRTAGRFSGSLYQPVWLISSPTKSARQLRSRLGPEAVGKLLIPPAEFPSAPATRYTRAMLCSPFRARLGSAKAAALFWASLFVLSGLGACAAGKSNTGDPHHDGAADHRLTFKDGQTPPGDGQTSREGVTPSDGPSIKPDTTQPIVVIVSEPKGGESWVAGSTQRIRWTASAPVSAVELELHKGGQFVATLATGQPAGGQWSWTISEVLVAGDDYTIVVVDPQSSETGTSPAFSILNWRYRRPLTVDTSALPQTLTTYPVAVRLTPQTFDYSHARADGADLRFSTKKSLAALDDLDFWIERWDPSGESLIWVNLPTLDPGAKTVEIQLFYGNSGVITSPSSEAKAFPQKTVQMGAKTLDGVQTYAWFQLSKTATLSITTGKSLRIEAQRIVIDGMVDGDGAGHAADSGPGAGGVGINAGGGGGGYGGAGGRGGYDGTGDTRGAAGLTNGQPASASIAMGSGGGGQASGGGAGGGALILVGEEIVIRGTVSVDGANSPGGAGTNGGGGSGGGVLILGYHVELSGTIRARGGAGGNGTSTLNDGGGGGGGGRIKVFHEGNYLKSGVVQVTGGAGGRYGDQHHGEAGKMGTTHASSAPYRRLTVTLGAEAAPEVTP